ncbi:MAG: hypothetical protein ACWA6X_11730 [Bauldia sp.]
MRSARDARRPVDVAANIEALGVEGALPGVEPHPHPHATLDGPWLGGETALGFGGGGHGRGALRNTTKNESPSVMISVPSGAIADLMIARWRSRTGAQAAVPSASTAFVDPSMSVKRNVTVPVGGAAPATRGTSV